MTRWAAAVVAAMLCLVVLTGCSGHPAAPGAGHAGFRLAQIGSTRFGGPTAARVQRTSTPPSNENAWTVASVDPASAAIRIAWIDGGTLRCGAVDRVQVFESTRAVVIGLAATHRDPELFCTLAGHPRTLTVHLRHALGSRALLEGASGADDGLATTDGTGRLPDPACSTGSGEADVPVGMLDVTSRMAPTDATSAFVCRTWWPKGIARTASIRIADRAEVRTLAAAIDAGSRAPRVGAPSRQCTDEDVHASWYSVYLRTPGGRVEVRSDAIRCRTITNGSISGTMTPTLVRTLDALFPS